MTSMVGAAATKESIIKAFAFHDIYIDMDPSFYTESCKWKKESLSKMLEHCGKSSAKILG